MSRPMLRAASWVALGGHLGLFATIIIWNVWVAPPEALPRILPVIVLAAPLLLVLRGLLRGRSGAYHAACLMALVYFALGVTNIAADEVWYGGLQTAASVLWFAGSALSLKRAGQTA